MNLEVALNCSWPESIECLDQIAVVTSSIFLEESDSERVVWLLLTLWTKSITKQACSCLQPPWLVCKKVVLWCAGAAIQSTFSLSLRWLVAMTMISMSDVQDLV